MDGHPLEQNPQRKSDHAANNAGCHLAFTSFLPPNRAAFSRAGPLSLSLLVVQIADYNRAPQHVQQRALFFLREPTHGLQGIFTFCVQRFGVFHY